MKKFLPFALVLTIGAVGATYVVDPGRYSCRWTIVGYVCPEIEVSIR